MNTKRKLLLFIKGGTYLLKDMFLQTITAGSLNNTMADIGGKRTVTDTNSKLSLSGGFLRFATGEAIADGVYYPSLTRKAGRLCILAINETTNNMRVGFNSAASGAVTSAGINFGPTTINIVDGSSGAQIGVATISTNYSLCILLRTSGMYAFVKGGTEYPRWTLLWIGGTNATATLFPGMTAAATTTVGIIDEYRIPLDLYLPTPLAYDTFTRANGVLGSTETSGPDSQGVGALAWTDAIGTWAIATNKASCSALSSSVGIATINTQVADIIIDAALTRSAGVLGVVLRYSNSSNYIIAYHDGTNAKLDKVIADVTTNVISAAATYSAGATLRVVAVGSSLQLFYNNAKVGSTSTINDAAVQTTTLHGLYTTNTSNTLDNFLVMPRGTNDEYSALNSF